MKRITIIVIVAALLAISAVLMACSWKSEPQVYTALKGHSIDDIMAKGRELYRANKRDSALLLFSIVAGKYNEDLPEEEKQEAILAMNNAAVIYQNYHLDYMQAFNYFSEALNLATKHNFTKAEAIIYLNMAELFRIYAQNQSTDVYMSKIHELTERGFNKAFQIGDYECMAATLMNQLVFDLSTPTARYKAIFNSNIPDTIRNVASTRMLMKAASLYSAKRYPEVRKLLGDANSSINSKWNPEYYEINVAKSIGDTYKSENKIDSARMWYAKVLAQADSINMVDMQLAMMAKLSQLDIPDAEQFRHRYLEKKDSVMSNCRLSMVGELDFLRELKLEQQKSAELSASKRTLLMWIAIGGGVLLIIGIFVVLIIRQAIRLRESNRALYLRINAQLDSEKPLTIVSDEADTLTDDNSKTDSVSDVAAPTPDSADKYSSSSLSDSRLDEIYAEIQKLLADPATVCSPNLSLSKLASIIDVNTSYVSRVINEKYGCSFSALVNDRRIKIACQRLSDVANYGNMTIEAISKSVGFSSRSTFISAFKKANGMTPSEYLKMARQVDAGK